MTKRLHIQLLESIEKEGVGVYTDLSPFFIQHFTKPTTTDQEQWAKEMYRHALFLKDLTQRGFITDNSEDGLELSNDLFANFKWFDEVDVMAYITSRGIDYLDKYDTSQANIELNKSYKDVNEASLRNYKTQKNGLIITAVIAFIAALFSVLGFFKTEPKMVQLNKNIQVLSKETEGIKLQIETLRNHLISYRDTSYKH